ncbi:MAG: ABC transporter ATP-binding protein [Clostridia bacterium]|nr:ABC transporter ATP-binding protein [Clostridia bacterium]
MKYLLRYLRPFYARMALGLFIKCGGTVLELFLPYILGHIIDEVVPLEDAGKVLIWGGIMILCAFGGVVMNVGANRMASKVARNASEAVRHDLFDKTMRLSGAQVDKFTVPSLESRLTSDTYNFHHFISMIQRLGVRAPMLLMGGFVITMIVDWRMSLVMFSILPLIGISVWLISRRGVPLYTQVQKSVDGMTRVVREDAQGIRVIKALSKTAYERDRYDRVNRQLVEDEKRAGITMAASNPLMTFFMNLGIVAVILVGAILVDGGLSKPGKILTFMQYFTLISQAMMSITRMFVMFTKSAASARRISEVLQCGEDLPIGSSADYPTRADGAEGYITFDKVNFSYNKTKNNLTDISFRLKRGGTLGIIGATGSGKTTLISLLMRLYDVDSGSVRIGGRDIRTIPADELHSKFGVAMQHDFLYADTVEENVSFGRDIQRQDLERAARMAQADFIEKFEDGWQHMLTSKGTNISGGQKQRLLISRALAGRPDILILDDSSSALDYKTDAALRRAIADGCDDMTVIVVAQRISSVMNSDVIIVLDEGEIIGMGDHDSLMRDCEVYREISMSQMGGAFLE